MFEEQWRPCGTEAQLFYYIRAATDTGIEVSRTLACDSNLSSPYLLCISLPPTLRMFWGSHVPPVLTADLLSASRTF